MSVLKYKDTDGQWKPLQNASANEGVHVGPNQPTGRENIWINPDEQPPSFQLPADYIVEIGSKDSWKWTKWNSGKLDLEGAPTVYCDLTPPLGAMFYNNPPCYFPSEVNFIEPPHVFLNVDRNWVFSQAAEIYKSHFKAYLFCPLKISNKENFRLFVKAIGRWK